MAKKGTSKIVVMAKEKVCKKVVRYATDDESAPVSNIYLAKTFSDPMPEKVEVIVNPA